MRSEIRHRHVRVLFAITVFTVILTNRAWPANYKVIDLNPSGFMASGANGISGTQQVGSGYTSEWNEHALLWNGSADSVIDLHPGRFDNSTAQAICGTQQVGYGYDNPGLGHALLWNGSADSCVYLNPSGFDYSMAFGTNGTQQVGDGFIGSNSYALLWNGSADNYVNLSQFLPTGFTSSEAWGIDSYGNIVGRATDALGSQHAIIWEVPEPATLLLLSIGGLILRRRK